MVPRENQRARRRPQAPRGQRRVLQRDPPQAPPGRDRRGRRADRRRLPGPQDLGRERRSGLAAVTQSAAVLKKGFTELDPLVAIVEPDACTACGDCLTACPYDAISMAEEGDRHVAVISPTGCKGCGGCVPICPENAIDLLGYTDAQITAMIDEPPGGARLMPATNRDVREVIREEPVMRPPDPRRPRRRPAHRPRDRRGDRRPDPRGRVLGHGHAPLRLAGRDQGQRRATATSATSRPGGCPDDRDHRSRHRADSAWTSGLYPEIQRFGATDISACFSLRHLHRDLPAVPDRRHLPAPDHPLRPARHEGRAALEQGALDLLPVRRVRRDAARPRPTRREFMAATRRYAIASLRQDPARPDDVHAARSSATVLARAPRRCSSPSFMYTAHGPQSGETLAIFDVHPRAADPQHWASS